MGGGGKGVYEEGVVLGLSSLIGITVGILWEVKEQMVARY